MIGWTTTGDNNKIEGFMVWVWWIFTYIIPQLMKYYILIKLVSGLHLILSEFWMILSIINQDYVYVCNNNITMLIVKVVIKN